MSMAAPKTNSETTKTTLVEIDYPKEFLDCIVFNQDIQITDELKDKIKAAKSFDLLRVAKEIGSTPIVIKSVDVYDEAFLLKNF